MSETPDAGEDVVDELADDTSCPDADPDGNGDNCREIRLHCKNKCIEKWISNGSGGGGWIAKCETTRSRALGCSPHSYW